MNNAPTPEIAPIFETNKRAGGTHTETPSGTKTVTVNPNNFETKELPAWKGDAAAIAKAMSNIDRYTPTDREVEATNDYQQKMAEEEEKNAAEEKARKAEESNLPGVAPKTYVGDDTIEKEPTTGKRASEKDQRSATQKAFDDKRKERQDDLEQAKQKRDTVRDAVKGKQSEVRNTALQQLHDYIPNVYKDGKWSLESGDRKTAPEALKMLELMKAKPQTASNIKDKTAESMDVIAINPRLHELIYSAVHGKADAITNALARQGGNVAATQEIINKAKAVYEMLKNKQDKTPLDDYVLYAFEHKNIGQALNKDALEGTGLAEDLKEQNRLVTNAKSRLANPPKTREDYEVSDIESLAGDYDLVGDEWRDYITNIPKGAKFIRVPQKNGAGHNIIAFDTRDDSGERTTYAYVPTKRNAFASYKLPKGLSNGAKLAMEWDIDKKHPYTYLPGVKLDDAISQLAMQAIGDTSTSDTDKYERAMRNFGTKAAREAASRPWKRQIGKTLDEIVADSKGAYKTPEETLEAISSIKDATGKNMFAVNKGDNKLYYSQNVDNEDRLLSESEKLALAKLVGRFSSMYKDDGTPKKGVEQLPDGKLIYRLPGDTQKHITFGKNGQIIETSNKGKTTVRQTGSYANKYKTEGDRMKAHILEQVQQYVNSGNTLSDEDLDTLSTLYAAQDGGELTPAKIQSAIRAINKAAGIASLDAEQQAEKDKKYIKFNQNVLNSLANSLGL